LRVSDGMIRHTVETLLAATALTLTVYAWLIDPFGNQRAFGALIGSAFVAFSMMIYVYYQPSLTGRSSTWLLAGCLTVSIFLLLAVQLAS
jgi:high-affinity Fe2+/Pb2+ permease